MEIAHIHKNLSLSSRMTHKCWIIALLLIGNSIIKGQMVELLNHDSLNFPVDTTKGQLSIHFNNSNFVKDNEYFNNIVEGYTLIGYWIEPTLSYNITSNTSVQAGISAVHFSGKNSFYKINPVFSFYHRFNPHISLLMGSIPYSQHQMPVPLLDPEKYYLHRVDDGAQILFQSKYFKADTWLSWDNFSYYGDSLQERITGGFSGKFFLVNSSNLNIEIPVYGIISHRGGQVNRPKQAIETLTNTGTGISCTLFDILKITPTIFYYKKLTSAPSQAFSEGWAFYPQIQLNFKSLIIESSWWHGQKFISPRGEKIYSLVSTYDTTIMKEQNIFINKIAYQHWLPYRVLLQASFESYYFFSGKLMDYNFMVHLNWYFDRRIVKF
jgi:hypothetical protein